MHFFLLQWKNRNKNTVFFCKIQQNIPLFLNFYYI